MKRKYALDESAFEVIDTEEKAYWLGFITADGCVMERTKYNRNAKYLSVKLAGKDTEHLRKFQAFLKSDIPIYTGTTKFCDKEFSYCAMHIYSTKLVEDLLQLGVTYRKSLKETFPNITPELKAAFIRGVWDGDGSVLYYEQKVNGKRKFRSEICLYGGVGLLSEISDIVKNVAGIGMSVTRNRTIFRIKTSGSKTVPVLKYLYGNASIYLDRKYSVYQTILEKEA